MNIQPNKGSIGSNEMALDSFTVEKTSISQYELFSIKAQTYNFGYFPGGQVGAALVDNKGNIAKVLGIKNFSELKPQARKTYKLDAFLQDDVSPGQYKLQMVTRIEGGEWKLITQSDRLANVPSSINLTVKPAEPGAPGGGYGLALTEFTSEKNSVTAEETFKVSIILKNMNEEKYPGGQLGVALVDNGGNIVEVIENYNLSELSSGYAKSIKNLSCKVTGIVSSGKYRLRIVVKPTGNNAWRVATMSVDNTPTAIDFTVK